MAPTPPAPPPVASPAPSHATFTGKGYRIVYPSDGRQARVWAAEAATIHVDGTTGAMTMTGVACDMYRDGARVLSVTAQSAHAIFDDATRSADVTLSGNVRASEPTRGLRLLADRFHWVSTRDQVTAEQVHWTGLGFDHRSPRGTFSTDLSRAVFEGHTITQYAGSPARK